LLASGHFDFVKDEYQTICAHTCITFPRGVFTEDSYQVFCTALEVEVENLPSTQFSHVYRVRHQSLVATIFGCQPATGNEKVPPFIHTPVYAVTPL